jgi:hypothetical protein
MSSKYVRDTIKNYLTATFPAEKFIDLSDGIDTISDLLAANGLTRTSPWVAIRFVGYIEEPVDIAAGDGIGCYRESGALYIDVAATAGLGAGDSILGRIEAIRSGLRGKRLGNIVIVSLTPPNFGGGASLDFEGGFISASTILEYRNDINL